MSRGGFIEDGELVTLQPLGDARVLITYAPGDGTALCTWRLGKDTDLAAIQLNDLALAFAKAALETRR